MLRSSYFLLVLGAIRVCDLWWYKPPWLTNMSSRCFAALLAKMSTFNSYEWTASSSLHMTPELEQWTWLLCRVSVSPANTLSLQGLTQLIGAKLLISRFQEFFLVSPNFQGGNARFAPPCRRPRAWSLCCPIQSSIKKIHFFLWKRYRSFHLRKLLKQIFVRNLLRVKPPKRSLLKIS